MMKRVKTAISVATPIAFLLGAASVAQGADTVRGIIVEADPVAPASASYEAQSSGVATSKYGLSADFNVGARISTGPEYWTGNFSAKGPKDMSEVSRTADLLPGERHKIEATRLRWMIGLWEQAQSMRGWFIKAGYSYTKITSRANRFDDAVAAAAAAGQAVNLSPDKETDIVTDTRHGVALAFGNRWMFMSQRLTLSAGASFTQDFKRVVTVDSSDPKAREDYDKMIADLPDSKISVRPTPELNIGLGYAF